MLRWERIAQSRFLEYRSLTRESTAQKLIRDLKAGQNGKPGPSSEDLEVFYESYRQRRIARYYGSDWRLADEIISKMPRVEPDRNTQVWGVILETREHENLECTVCDTHDQLAIPIQLIHGRSNRDFILNSRIGDLIRSGEVVLSEIDDTEFSIGAYNGLFMSTGFWKKLCGRKKILVFQTDSILCPTSEFKLQDFLLFDYIGSAWNYEAEPDVALKGGNGGFSLRDWSRSVHCLKQFPPNLWPSSEDKYFAFHMELSGANVASGNDSSKFGSEKWFLYRSFGAHQLALMSPVQLGLFLDYCPEAIRISDGQDVDRGIIRRLRARIKNFVLRQALQRVDNRPQLTAKSCGTPTNVQETNTA